MAVQFTLARNPVGSGVETNNHTPNKLIFTTWIFISKVSQSLTCGAKKAEQMNPVRISFMCDTELYLSKHNMANQDFTSCGSYLGTEDTQCKLDSRDEV